MDRTEKLKQFKKSNKERREKIAKKEGFSTVEDYLKFLSTGAKTKIITAGKLKSKKTGGTTTVIKKEKLDYVVAFDTTGSMASYINNVKEHVRELIPNMFKQDIDLKMRIIAFGDYCDMESATKFGKAYQESEFTNDTNKLVSFVNGAQNTAGGDGDEFYELVIKKITEETPWRTGAKKAVLFIADDNPHEVNYSFGKIVQNAGIDWKKEAEKAAKLEIGFDTLSIHGDSRPWYKKLSEITGGVYMPFKSSNKMAEVVAASAYVRGSKKSKGVFYTAMSSALSSGDTELYGTYKSLSSLDTE
jgi:hypothetical protein